MCGFSKLEANIGDGGSTIGGKNSGKYPPSSTGVLITKPSIHDLSGLYCIRIELLVSWQDFVHLPTCEGRRGMDSSLINDLQSLRFVEITGH